jgi:transcriptional regulator with XRE-family HTH domain
MKEKGVSQIKFADDFSHLGVKKQTVTDWKRGHSNTFFSIILEIANYFNVSTDYLLGNTDDPTPPKKEFTSQDKLNYEIAKLTPENRKQAEKFIEFLKTQEDFSAELKNGLGSQAPKPQT